MLSENEAIPLLNRMGKSQTPFSFYCDFLGEKWCVQKKGDKSQFKIDLLGNQSEHTTRNIDFGSQPISLQAYQSAFDEVVRQINIGNSFLTNLTFQTPIETNLGLDQIFKQAKAKYKLLVPGQFVVFSPETFIQIRNNKIYSFPMKGTIDADLPNAAQVIMEDEKETAEHVTIVDLIRNDLSQVSNNVQVSKFRFFDEIQTNKKRLLQISSEIQGTLGTGWKQNLGTILRTLLPAGSISGAPKPQTIQIIRTVEKYDRRFYTGVCGQFDGNSLDTGVMIRFIQKQGEKLFYHSGGGITSFSKMEKEYHEMVDKVYLPM